MAYRETTSKKVIARRVRRLRTRFLETQAEFAAHFGVRALEVWRWEHAVKAPRLCHQRTLYALEIQLANRKLERGTRK